MEPATSKEADKPQMPHQHVREATKASSNRFTQPNSAAQIRRKGQHLDVDGILARSLPQTVVQSSSFKRGAKAD